MALIRVPVTTENGPLPVCANKPACNMPMAEILFRRANEGSNVLIAMCPHCYTIITLAANLKREGL